MFNDFAKIRNYWNFMVMWKNPLTFAPSNLQGVQCTKIYVVYTCSMVNLLFVYGSSVPRS